jgi:ParB family chromosome partitioning protein
VELRLIAHSRITEDPGQPRKHLDDEALQGLADSIRQHGMLNPITVRPLGSDQYRIVTGERRWRAAIIANLQELPCIVKQMSEDELLTEQLIENLQREDLQPLDKARAIDHVKRSLGQTNREIARRLGINERTIGYLLDLLALPEEIGETVISSPNRPSDGNLTEKHARFLKQLNDAPELQSAVVDRIRADKLSSEDTGNLVKALKKSPNQAKSILNSPTDHLEQFFQDTFDPNADFLAEQDSSPRLSPHAQRVLDFLPSLAGIDPMRLAPPEIRQIQDALTSLRMAVDGLLKCCREQLGE